MYKKEDDGLGLLSAHLKEMEEINESSIVGIGALTESEKEKLKEELYGKLYDYFSRRRYRNDYREKILKDIFKVDNYSGIGIIRKENKKLTLQERLAEFKLKKKSLN